MQEVGYGDIVQIDPVKDTKFGGCYMFVEEAKENGISGFIQIPGRGKAYIQKAWEDIEWCGQSVWDKK